MSKKFVLAAVFSLSSLLAVLSAAAAGDAEAGKVSAAMCASCHGEDGNSFNPEWPKLAGQHAKYLVKQIKDFKSGARKNDMMAPMAQALSDQDAENVAAYFASQATSKGNPATGEQAELGARIYKGGNKASGVSACMACHGPNGMGNPAAGFPRLAGQHAAYTANQLKIFRSGARSNDPAKMMQNIAARMTDAEIAAVAAFIEGM